MRSIPQDIISNKPKWKYLSSQDITIITLDINTSTSRIFLRMRLLLKKAGEIESQVMNRIELSSDSRENYLHQVYNMNFYSVYFKLRNAKDQKKEASILMDSVDFNILIDKSNSRVVYSITKQESKFLVLSTLQSTPPDIISLAILRVDHFGKEKQERIKIVIYIMNLSPFKAYSDRVVCKEEIPLKDEEVDKLRKLLKNNEASPYSLN